MDCPWAGDCNINTVDLIKCFGKSFISKYHRSGEKPVYRFMNKKLGIKIQINESDALFLINSLKLCHIQNPVFINSSIFKRS